MPGKLSHFTHQPQAPPGWVWGLGALAEPSTRHWDAQQPRSVKAHDLSWPGFPPRGLSEACCKNDEWLSHFQALADLGSYWQAHHSQHVSQLITSNFIFLVNTSWQIGHYLFILQQWALLLFWWCLEVLLLFSASSFRLKWRALRETTRKKPSGKGTKGGGWQMELKATQLPWLKVEVIFWVRSWFLGFSLSKSSDSVYYVDEVGKQKFNELASSDMAALNAPHLTVEADVSWPFTPLRSQATL